MQNTQASDNDLVQGYILGQESNLEILLERHQHKVFGYIYNLCKNRDLCDDIFQETFVKVIHTLKSGKYNEEGKFLPWVMRIAHNLVIDHFRKKAKMPKAESKNEEFDIFSTLKIAEKNVQDELIDGQILDSVKKLIDFLPDEQREVVLMRHYDELSFKEIADKTGVSINTALGRMRYALINLRKLIEEHEIVLSH
ncbi:MAG TPA: sigma-70 family RNA polymerase sigma factor [Flavobacteriales bacterium]|nr:sigma-70 family RNA polymerase sigma factor [Flavobacteriales bacterium]